MAQARIVCSTGGRHVLTNANSTRLLRSKPRGSDIQLFLQVLIQSLSNAGVYILLGAGVSIIFGIMRILNFAQGELMTVPAYLGLVVVGLLPIGPPWAALIALVVILPVSGLFGWAFYRGLLKPLEKHDPFMVVVATFGAALLIQGIIYLVWGGVPIGIQRSTGAWRLGGVAVTHAAAVNISLAVITIVALNWMLTRTSIGREMRAVAQNRDGASLSGIRSERAAAVATALAAILAGIAGIIILQRSLLTPFIGFEVVLKAFAISIVAGLGRMSGLLTTGIILGLAEGIVGTYISAALSDLAIFAVVVIVLLVRPSGISGVRVRA